MIEKSREKGYLSTWQPGEDILACIANNIQKAVTSGSGSIDMGEGFNSASFTPGILGEINKAQEKVPGYFLVSMNEGKTVSTKETATNKIKVLSLGQGGCINVVIGGKDENGELSLSVFHFSPVNVSALMDSIIQEREKYSRSMSTKAVIFSTPDTEQLVLNMLSSSIEQFPHSSIEFGNTDKDVLSHDNLLIVSADKEKQEINIAMKGQDFRWRM